MDQLVTPRRGLIAAAAAGAALGLAGCGKGEAHDKDVGADSKAKQVEAPWRRKDRPSLG